MKKLNLQKKSEELIIDFDKLNSVMGFNVIPVAVQDVNTKEFLMLAYANKEALNKTLESGKASFWSTSRKKLWVKGETSGSVLKVVEVRVNCEQNSLLYLVISTKEKGVCHTQDENGENRKTCFYRSIRKGKGRIILKKIIRK